MLGAAPIKHDRLTCAAQIVDCDRHKRILPLHIFETDLERAEIWRREFARQNALRAIHHGFINSAMQLLRLHAGGNIQRFGQKIGVGGCSFLHFAAFHFAVGSRNFFHRFECILIRDPEYRPDHILFPAP